MPRKTKDNKEAIEAVEVKKKTTKKDTNKKTANATVEKKVSSKTTKTTAEKKVSSKATKTTAKKEATKKASSKSATKKVATTKKTTKVAKAKVEKKSKTDSKSKKSTSTTKSKESPKKTTKKTTKKSNTKKPKVEILEYYDLPYRYNQTIVRILAQTPSTLFVYWDISDEDKENYIKQFGEYFFNNTKPVLIINNLTKNYSYEIDINDFANSWYLHIEDSKCDYKIELGRRPINNYVSIPNNYLYISTSNNIESPNDHILFEKLSNIIYFRNIKTNTNISKTNLYYLERIKNFYSIKDFYKEMYRDEDFNFDTFTLNNPSSSSSTLKN